MQSGGTVPRVSDALLYLVDMTFNAFANRVDPDQATLIRAA